MKIASLTLIVCSLVAGACLAAGPAEIKTDRDRINYSVGYQIGNDFRKQGIELDPDRIVQGIRDAFEGNEPKMPEKDMRKTLVTLKAGITASERMRKGGWPATDPAEVQAFFAANAGKEGVVTLPSGLQYKVIREGTGKTAFAEDNVAINYRGTLANGSEFYNSLKTGKPADIPVGKLVPGLREALLMMKEGSRWQLFIPPALGYRDGSPLEGKPVIYDIDLIGVKSPQDPAGRKE